MTADELAKLIRGGLDRLDHVEVDAETYSNVCQRVFDMCGNVGLNTINSAAAKNLNVLIGRNNGIIFNGVEIILKETEDDTPCQEDNSTAQLRVSS